MRHDTVAVLAALALAGAVVLGSGSGARCHARGALPDAKCTPGVVNPLVIQANIKQTVCMPGWTATVRPPASYTNKLKAQQIAAYGYDDADPKDYEEDHQISLELGGASRDPRNLWPEPHASSSNKDKVENRLHRAVCAGTLTLAQAQREIATDWTAAP